MKLTAFKVDQFQLTTFEQSRYRLRRLAYEKTERMKNIQCTLGRTEKKNE